MHQTRTWQTLLLLFIPLLFLSYTHALHESDVGVVDWHKSHAGVPAVSSSTTAPKFHRVGGKNSQSVIISATESNTLAAWNAVNGSVVVASLSGPGGANLRLFNVLNGDLLLEKQSHTPASGLLAEPPHLGSYVAFGNDTMGVGTSDLFVLTNGQTVSHYIGRDRKWTWNSEDQTSLVIYTNLFVTSQAIYVIGLAKSFASYTLHVTAISPATGEQISSSNIPSSIGGGPDDLFSMMSPTGDPYVLWLEQNTIKYFPLTPSLAGKPKSFKSASYHKLTDVGLNSYGFLLATKIDQTDQALKLVGNGDLQVAWEFEGSAPTENNSKSSYAGGFDKEGRPYVGRLYWSYFLERASAELFAPHLSDGRGLIAGFSFNLDKDQHGKIAHVTMDFANPNMYQVLGRLFVTTSAGTVELYQQDKLQWSRDESLAEITNAEFVELPERVLATAEGNEPFLARLERQIKEAKDFPNYLVHFVKRFATGSYESATSSAAPKNQKRKGEGDGGLHRDAFGFRQVIVLSTKRGKVVGVDSSNGEVLWSRLLGLGLGAAAKRDQEGAGAWVRPVKTFLVKAVGEATGTGGNMEGAEVVVVAERGTASGSDGEIVVYHLNALTGENATKAWRKPGPLRGTKVASGSVTESYLLKSPSGGKVVVVLDDKLKVHLYPDTPESRSAFTASASSLSVPLRLRAETIGQHRIVGHQFLQDSDTAVPTWTFSLPDGEDIQSIIPPTRGSIASLGKVLGNRTTLYKYLNEHLFVVLTAPHSQSQSFGSTTRTSGCGIYLVDGVKGSTVYHASVPTSTGGTGGGCDVKAVLTENWLVYHYFDEDYQGAGPGQTKGYRMVSVELYEGQGVDDKTRSSELTSYSEKTLDVKAIERSFVYSHGISAIATTKTKFGITSRDVIVANNNNKIHSISRRLLDPRRPNRKPTSEEAEEFLVQYDPLLPDDPRQVLSHNYKISRVEKIVTAPALLESTSLVFVYGLDLFLTRVAPSKTFDVLSESFNKTQLVLTVAALALAILFAKPAVNRKKLRERWYSYELLSSSTTNPLSLILTMQMLFQYWLFISSTILALRHSRADEITCTQNTTLTTVEDLISCFDSYTVPEEFYNEQTYASAQPTPAEEDAWEEVISAVLNGNGNGNCSDVQIPDVLEGVYAVSSFGGFCVLHERKAQPNPDPEGGPIFVRGWGTLVVPNSSSDSGVPRPGVHLSAPHPQYDLFTPEQAGALFEGVGARSLLVAGRSRLALLNATTCVQPGSGTTGTVYYVTDPAHNDKEPFVTASKAIWKWQQTQGGCPSSSCAFIQMHGKGASSCPTDTAFISTGLGRSESSIAWYTDDVDRPVKRIQKNIRQAEPSWNVSLPSDSNCSLVATTNVFGRFINGVPENMVCEQAANASLATGAFVHIEQASVSRQPAAYNAWITALNESFPVNV
ncbi:hypothetical protein V5O48_008907 [Marasmius crinis-equi]|uniref:ER membrane protein complex subunit 1 n=1 Tax=Marasmius crinis-equi TaxID=585013 RepID=A0ABR3FCM0_9AGAR